MQLKTIRHSGSNTSITAPKKQVQKIMNFINEAVASVSHGLDSGLKVNHALTHHCLCIVRNRNNTLVTVGRVNTARLLDMCGNHG
jgi:hypothetical protein